MQEEQAFYRLPEESLPGISYKEHAEDLWGFRALIDSLGIKTHNTRISRYVQYFDEVASGGDINEQKIFKNVKDARFSSPLDWQLYLLREAHELMWIFRGLKKHAPKGIENKLEQLVRGSDFAALDTNTEPRDTQFELRVASYFCQAGSMVDVSTDTDVIAIGEDHAYIIECKRIAGIRNLRDNLMKAREQIALRIPRTLEGRRAFGVIAADVTKLGFLHNGLTMGMTADHTKDIIQKKLLLIAQQVEKLKIFNGCPEVVECWLQIHMPAIIMHPPATITRFSSFSASNPKADRRSRRAIKELHFITQVVRSVDDREIKPKKLKLRSSIEVPAGTEFYLERELVNTVLSGEKFEGYSQEKVIASMKANGVTHEFTVIELEIVMGRFTSEQILKLLASDGQERIELILQMFAQRYPYEESVY
ncbi:hypothetical protein FCI59_02280 [Pseudomonas protegens]|uniref:hypothetical protein n=1 Tax=Pseudomonas protegens TaxID=380021 RepID=UPI0015775234|nr:hypothetical protein [Pseudomonas protegens]NTZ70142.1 hypothetical protein [Pseudomonas protegens]